MFFYPEDYLRLRDRVAAHGCQVPIIPGIMPITSVRIVDKAVELGGTRIPAELSERLHAVSDDRAAVREIGVDYAASMCERLLAEGVPGLHFYTLNWSRRHARDLPAARPGGARGPDADVRAGPPRPSGADVAQRQRGPHHRVGRIPAGEPESGQQIDESRAAVQMPRG